MPRCINVIPSIVIDGDAQRSHEMWRWQGRALQDKTIQLHGAVPRSMRRSCCCTPLLRGWCASSTLSPCSCLKVSLISWAGLVGGSCSLTLLWVTVRERQQDLGQAVLQVHPRDGTHHVSVHDLLCQRCIFWLAILRQGQAHGTQVVINGLQAVQRPHSRQGTGTLCNGLAFKVASALRNQHSAIAGHEQDCTEVAFPFAAGCAPWTKLHVLSVSRQAVAVALQDVLCA
mmetsp:Transcript_28766/g.74197  ORF Transcript_28766/g.74197 Transcript_28766/m.74197 type:complete len:229 (-) Transcript_28766:2233-2919(-)